MPLASLGSRPGPAALWPFVHRAPSGQVLFQKEPTAGTGLPISPTFHHVLLVVAVIVTVSGAVVDVKTMDGSVVVAGWDILQRMGGRAEITRDVSAPYHSRWGAVGVNGMGQEEDPAGRSSLCCCWFAQQELPSKSSGLFYTLTPHFSQTVHESGPVPPSIQYSSPSPQPQPTLPRKNSSATATQLGKDKHTFTLAPVGSWLPDKLHLAMNW